MPPSSSSTTASVSASSSTRSSDGGCLLVLSPHCDDAVLGVGELLASRPGSVVVTIFAGRPPAGAPLTPWDAAAGFHEGDDVMGVRRAEDQAALAVLGARARWLPFHDAQYGGPLGADAIVGGVAAVVSAARASAVAIPLGLFHDDHRTTHEAALRVARRRPELSWLLYADALYRRIPDVLERRLAALAEAGAIVEPLPPVTGHASLKRRAIGCYRSQLQALGTPGRPGIADALAPEQYWRLRP